jgi:hypothetical protein
VPLPGVQVQPRSPGHAHPAYVYPARRRRGAVDAGETRLGEAGRLVGYKDEGARVWVDIRMKGDASGWI